MIAISSDTDIVVISESVANSDKGDLFPRISRTATLDGGSVITTSGCSHSDRTIVISADNVPPQQETILRRMAKTSLSVQMSNAEGVFIGYISQFSAKSGSVKIEFLVKEKLTPD